MQDGKGDSGQVRSADRKPRVTPDMFWPGPQKGRSGAPPAPAHVGSGLRATPAAPVGAQGQAQGQARTVVPMIHPSIRASRSNEPSLRASRSRSSHPSVWARMPEPRVILGEGNDVVDLSDCGNRCGNGMWCKSCRADIRAEALRWLRELNVIRPSGAGTDLSWTRAWNRELLLADY